MIFLQSMNPYVLSYNVLTVQIFIYPYGTLHFCSVYAFREFQAANSFKCEGFT